jgi:N-acetylglucosamine kinase
MIAAGIDLGGTKAEVQIFGTDWNIEARDRTQTPKDYDQLVKMLARQIAWVDEKVGRKIPIGIGAAGLINPITGLALTANLPATGRPFPYDINQAAGRKISYINDCRAFGLSEAVFGAGFDYGVVMALNLGTGIGGGIVVDKKLLSGPTRTGGEFGHIAAPAYLLQQYSLPILTCGCGRLGCFEAYISGLGMGRLAKIVLDRDLTPREIGAQKDLGARQVWNIWCSLTAELLRSLCLTVDPDVIVLGGGMSQIPGVEGDLKTALKGDVIGDFGVPKITLAAGGNTSGARGAAFHAIMEVKK